MGDIYLPTSQDNNIFDRRQQTKSPLRIHTLVSLLVANNIYLPTAEDNNRQQDPSLRFHLSVPKMFYQPHYHHMAHPSTSRPHSLHHRDREYNRLLQVREKLSTWAEE